MAGAPQRIATVAVADLAVDVATVDVLARLALLARRRGCELCLRGASPELLGLIELVGLSDVLHAEEVARDGAATGEEPPGSESGLGAGGEI